MNNTSLQLTIRGLDQETKDALQQKASQQGISVNKYVLKTLQQRAGVNTSKNRYLELKKFLENHSMNISDKAAFDDALAWADKSSKEKQTREEHDSNI